MLGGTITAIITPFDGAGQLDGAGLRQHIRFQLENGIDGIVALGTTGESPTLTAREKEQVIGITVEEVNGRVPVIIGTGCNSTQNTVESTRLAKSLGADAALIITPYYNKPTQEGIYRHFLTVAEEASLPLIIYNHPGRTGQPVFLQTIQRLAAHPLIVGIKECAGSLSQMMDIFEAACIGNDGFSLLTGDDLLTLPCMAIGGHGVISVASNIIPASIVTLVKALKGNNYATAREIHYKLQPFIRSLFLETNPIPLKAIMNHLGMPAGECRLPLCELQAASKTVLLENWTQCLHSVSPIS